MNGNWRNFLSVTMLSGLLLFTTGISQCEPQDLDDDGWTIEDGDCDDEDPQTYPGADEVCDGKDNDCDNIPDNGPGDDCDGDGWTVEDGDCDNASGTVYPGAIELCDDLDQDCDGIVNNTIGPVCIESTNQAYMKISWALDDAYGGDRIWVSPGTYLEHDITSYVASNVTITATAGAEVTIIDAQSLGHGMYFSGVDNMTLRGLTITGGVGGYR